MANCRAGAEIARANLHPVNKMRKKSLFSRVGTMLGNIHFPKKWEYAHHLLTAAVIASFTLLFDMSGHLAWLDTVSLRLANTLKGHQIVQQIPKSDVPVTLLVTDTLYEEAFNQSSPLDREKLAELLEPVLSQKPALLAVDIDFSPGANDPQGNSSGQVKLDNLLDAAAKDGCISKQTQEKHEGCKIVLAIPLPVDSPSLQQLQFDWMKNRCAAGIQFADISLLQHQGTVLKHSSTAPLLGNVAAWWLTQNTSSDHKNSPHEDGEQSSIAKDHGAICSLLVKSKSPSGFLTDMESVQKDKQTVPLNTDYFESSGNLVPLNNLSLESIQKTVDVRDRVVFLGGSYGKDDNFATASGEQAGVTIHAATFYSATHGISAPSHATAWLLDILLGLVMGIVFEKLWVKYNEASEKIQAANTWREKFIAFVLTKILLAVNVTVLLLLILLFLYFAAWLLSNGWWLNPGPMMIGMFMDTLLSSRLKKEHHPATGGALLKGHLDIFWQVPLVLYVVYTLFAGHH